MADTEFAPKFDRGALGQVVLVLQGGGALGAYQAGVYQELREAENEPDWVIGTSIGAINAAIIAGNPPELRTARLREFWTRVQHGPLTQVVQAASMFGQWAANAMTLASGVPNFFEPNLHASLGSEFAG